jgi:hypothetical protein
MSRCKPLPQFLNRAVSSRNTRLRISWIGIVSLCMVGLSVQSRCDQPDADDNAPFDCSEFRNCPSLDSIRRVTVWAMPLVELVRMQDRMRWIKRYGVSGGAPVAPVNHLAMRTCPVGTEFRSVRCPNPDVVYGFGILDLSDGPVILQIPDFKDAFWLIQVGDHRYESFGSLGSMYGTTPGRVLIVGPDWDGVANHATSISRASVRIAAIVMKFTRGTF